MGPLTEQRMSEYQRRASLLRTGPSPAGGRKAGRQAAARAGKARGKFDPRAGILYQTVSRLPVANQDFLGSGMVDIRREGRHPPGGSQPEISSPEKTHRTPERALPLRTQETKWPGSER